MTSSSTRLSGSFSSLAPTGPLVPARSASNRRRPPPSSWEVSWGKLRWGSGCRGRVDCPALAVSEASPLGNPIRRASLGKPIRRRRRHEEGEWRGRRDRERETRLGCESAAQPRHGRSRRTRPRLGTAAAEARLRLGSLRRKGLQAAIARPDTRRRSSPQRYVAGFLGGIRRPKYTGVLIHQRVTDPCRQRITFA